MHSILLRIVFFLMIGFRLVANIGVSVSSQWRTQMILLNLNIVFRQIKQGYSDHLTFINFEALCTTITFCSRIR